MATRDQTSFLRITAIGIYLRNCPQTHGFGSGRLLAIRTGQDCERRIDRFDGSDYGVRDVTIFFSDIAERAVSLHIGDAVASIDRERLRGADLICDQALDLAG